MNYGDHNKYYMVIIGVLFLVGVGMAVMGSMVTASSRSETGKGPWVYILLGVFVFFGGWMFMDRVLFPEKFGHLPLIDFIKFWFEQKKGSF